MTSFVKKLPNYFTYLRLALIPVFVILLIEPNRAMVDAALVVFIIASLTDYIDGYLARKYGAVSDFGKLLDPIADKILVMSALVMLAGIRSEGNCQPWVPTWMVVLVLSREIWITGLRAVAASSGRIIAASGAGKLKSALQMAAIAALLLHDRGVELKGGYQIDGEWLGARLLLVSIVLSYYGAVEYTYTILGADKATEAQPPASQ